MRGVGKASPEGACITDNTSFVFHYFRLKELGYGSSHESFVDDYDWNRFPSFGPLSS